MFVQSMDFKEFESLLGKDVSSANQVLLAEGFECKKKSRDLYSVFDRDKWFYGMA